MTTRSIFSSCRKVRIWSAAIPGRTTILQRMPMLLARWARDSRQCFWARAALAQSESRIAEVSDEATATVSVA